MFMELNEFVNGNNVFGDDSKVSMKNRGNILFVQKMIAGMRFLLLWLPICKCTQQVIY